MRIALKVAYDGTEFFGFARQKHRRTVQGMLEERLSLLLRGPVEITGAGRTDRGVHAAGQVVSFDVPGSRIAPGGRVEPGWVAARLNRWLAPEVSVRAAAEVPVEFDARFSARRRAYEYRCYVAGARDPFHDRFALWLPQAPVMQAMRTAAKALTGEHDFSSFCRRGEGSLVRRVRRLAITAPEDGAVVFSIAADSFCHQMVRSIVGTLLAVGSGARAPGDVARALAARDRSKAGPVAPARGLTLTVVEYRPDPFAHDSRASRPGTSRADLDKTGVATVASRADRRLGSPSRGGGGRR